MRLGALMAGMILLGTVVFTTASSEPRDSPLIGIRCNTYGEACRLLCSLLEPPLTDIVRRIIGCIPYSQDP